MKLTTEQKYLIGGAAIILLFPEILRLFARQTVAATGDIVGGAVEGVGVAVGIPPTNKTRCIESVSKDESWDASFDCPAAVWGYSLFHTPEESANYAREYYASRGL